MPLRTGGGISSFSAYSGVGVSDVQREPILFLMPWLVMGGADKFMLDLIAALDKARFRCLICTTLPSKNEWHHRFAEHAEEILQLPEHAPKELWPEVLRDLMHRHRIRLVFLSHCRYGYELLPWLKEHVQHSFAAVDYLHIEEKNWGRGGFVGISADAAPWLAKTYTSSRILRECVVEQYGRDPDAVEAAPIGVDALDAFHPDHVPRGTIRRRARLSESMPVLLFPCRLVAQKRPYLILYIARALKKRGCRFRLWIVGKGAEERRMRRLTERYGLQKFVTFWGAQEDLRPFYRDADLTVVCSIAEGISLTTYESMAMGTPVLTSDVGGQRELVVPGTGMVLPMEMDERRDYRSRRPRSDEVRRYVKTLLALFRHPRRLQKMGRAARQHVVEHYLWEERVRAFEQDFVRLIEKTEPPAPD